ncbi:DNA-binding transcriptional regulator [Ruminococcus bicirculans (ex Wegman et al. 2014)]|uniref:helix-turn-helix domain-containing protein n=1 Tax=Ruminococcus bicirculans (ex Wegman et al. 2014) TaxID=1160721 RepID=UPI00242A8E44|nr:helix-turn-helix domain-containing protein [Ruminococcus bicirculans (ex Wegman et al. 2014)]
MPDISAEDIKAIRKKLGFTQAVFAAVIGVSTKTVEAWETGTNQPIGSARRMISLIQFAPEILQSYHIVNENVI